MNNSRQSGPQNDRDPAVAGMFYDGDAAGLADEVDGFLSGATECPPVDDPFGIIVPHAGYAYSGSVAAAAYRSVAASNPDLIVLLGPCHRQLYDFVSIGNYAAYRTPLGSVAVDLQTASALSALDPGLFRPGEPAHRREHSLEVQLPFLQRIFGERFRILPLLFGGGLNRSQLEQCAGVLYRLQQQTPASRWLVVCSTDLSHDHSYDEAVAMDRLAAEAVAGLAPDRLDLLLEQGRVEACGRDGLLVSLYWALLSGRRQAALCALRNSGDVVGDRESRIVGYLSAVI